MLLRRVMENMQNQNWLAVILDFLIVVLGVVAAFQLQSWGESRAAKVRAQHSLLQLYEESEQILADWVQMVERNDRRLERQDQVVAAFFAGHRGGLSDEDLARGLISITHFPTITPPRRVYDELRSAGLLREIDSPEALASVSAYYESLSFIQGQIVFFRPKAGDDDLRHGRGINFLYDASSFTRRNIEIDFETLAADPMFINDHVGLLRNRIIFQTYRRGNLRRAAEMCQALAEALGKVCEGSADFERVNELPEWHTRSLPPRE